MRRPGFTVAGIISSGLNEETRLFGVAASPYTKLNKYCNVPSKITFTVSIPNTPRWSKKLPVLSLDKYVTVDGYGVSVARDEEGYTTSINIELEKITVQGKLALPPSAVPLRK